MTWWRDPVPRSSYTQNHQDQIVLWWITYLWLSAHGYLHTAESGRESLQLVPTLEANSQTLRAIAKNAIREALIRHDGIQAYAAKELGINPRAMHYQVHRHGLQSYCAPVTGRKVVVVRRSA